MKHRAKTLIKSLAFALAAIVLFMGILKLDGVCMREWEFSIVPFAIIGVIVAAICVLLAIKAQSQAIKLSFAYLSILPLCLACGEVFFWLKQSHAKHTMPHAILGFTNTPLATIDTRYVVDDELVYHAHYTHDTNGYRITPSNNASPVCINIYGGSFAYGSGLSDHETLGAFLAKDLSKFHINNFGIGGAGAHQMLARLEFDIDSAALEACDENLFLYVAIPHHLYRALGAVQGPKYLLDASNTPKYQGVFDKNATKPFYKQDNTPKHFGATDRLANQLAKSYIKQYFSSPYQHLSAKFLLTQEMFQIGVGAHPDINLPPSSMQPYFAIVRQIKQTLHDKYNATLHVIFWDYDMHAQFLDKYDSLIESSFKRDQIPYTKVSEILGEGYKQDLARVKQGDFDHLTYRISRWDTHPNALANQKIAEYIARAITQGKLTFAKAPAKPQATPPHPSKPPHKEQK